MSTAAHLKETFAGITTAGVRDAAKMNAGNAFGRDAQAELERRERHAEAVVARATVQA